jgi:amino-acid N-acetyltransferase
MSATGGVRAAKPTDLPNIMSFLKNNGLPTNGVEKCLTNFVVAEDKDGSWVGIAGLEVYGKGGLLRSVAVGKQYRGLGHGRKLVDAVLGNAKARGIQTVYLLTDSADAYFKGLGFEAVDRENIDEAVKASPEFTECCETAVAMRKTIG